MRQDEFDGLRRGDLIRHAIEAKALVVDDSYRNSKGQKIVLATLVIRVTHPAEWDLVAKANYSV